MNIKQPRKTLVFIIFALLQITIVGCSTSHSDKTIQKESRVEKHEAEQIRFSALLTNAEWGSDPVSKRILEKTGVYLDFEAITGSINQKIGIMLASRDYPEILLSVSNETIARFIENGSLISIDSYLPEYGNHIQELFGNDLNKMRSEIDGKIYGVNREYKGQSARSQAIFHVQYAMLMDAGYPELKTLDDLYILMKEYKKKNPEFQGMETIGLTAWADSYGMNVTFNNPALRSGGFQNDGNYYVDENRMVQYGLTTEVAKSYFKWLNKLKREGLFDQEAVVQKRDMFEAKVSSGRVLVVTTEYWDLVDAQSSLRKQGLYDRCYGSFPLLLSKDIESNISNYDDTGSWKTVITDKCKDPERAVQFFNTMWSEEMQVLCNWGIEGEHYVVENGRRVLKQEIYEMMNTDTDWRSKTGLQTYLMWSVGEGVKGSDGQYISPFGNRESVIREQDAVTKEVLSNYNITLWKDLCPPARLSHWEFVWKLPLPQDSEGALAEARVNDDIRRKAIPKIIMAQSDEEFEQEWDLFVRSVQEAGISVREKEISESLKKRKGLR